MKLRLLYALFWLEWRLLANGIRQGKNRGKWELLARVLDIAVKILLVVSLIPVLLFMAGGGLTAGWFWTDPEWSGLVTLLLPAVLTPLYGWMVIRPLISAGTGALAGRPLLRLLPIPGRLLEYLEQVRILFDPVFLLWSPLVLMMPVGVLIGGKPLQALVALVAGVSMLLLLAALAGLISLACQLLLRRRWRQELAILAGVLLFICVSLLPQLMIWHSREKQTARPEAETTVARSQPSSDPEVAGPADGQLEDSPNRTAKTKPLTGEEIRQKVQRHLPAVLGYLPAAWYGAILEAAAWSRWAGLALPFAALWGFSWAAFTLSRFLYRRLLDPAGDNPASRKWKGTGKWWRIPGIPLEVAAVAGLHARTFFRTVRGKMALLAPFLMALLLGLVWLRNQAPDDRSPFYLFGVAALMTMVGLIHFAQFNCNQWAVAGRGLLLEFLLPIPWGMLIRGRWLTGLGLFGAAVLPALLSLAILCRGWPVLIWLVLLMTILATKSALGPVELVLACYFPKSINLASLKRSEQIHQAAVLLLMLSTILLMLPGAAVSLLPYYLTGEAWLALVLSTAWLILTMLGSWWILPKLGGLVHQRRETLILTASER